MLRKNIYQAIDELYPETVKIRRHLHQYPELSFQETKTAKFIADFYEELGIPYEKNVGGNGVLATLKGGKPGKTVALRADFDALPIQEENDLPYRSQHKGVMHACGHDGHTASLLTIAKAVQDYQAELPGTIIFLHQHAEELPPGGAKSIIETGKLDHIDAIFGNHLWANVPLGVVQTASHEFMAGSDQFDITLIGKGGHGGYPHETNDALLAACQLVSSLQTIVSRQVNPLDAAVVTVGAFHSGTTYNAIAGEARLKGTVRYLHPEIQKDVKASLERIIKGVCSGFALEYQFAYKEGYPPTINHSFATEIIKETCQAIPEVSKVEEIRPVMGAEDFSYYLLKKPGAFFFTGAQLGKTPRSHHQGNVDFDERSFPIAAKILIGAYLNYQASVAE